MSGIQQADNSFEMAPSQVETQEPGAFLYFLSIEVHGKDG